MLLFINLKIKRVTCTCSQTYKIKPSIVLLNETIFIDFKLKIAPLTLVWVNPPYQIDNNL